MTVTAQPVLDAIASVPRSTFVASPDLAYLLSGHSIPSRQVVEQFLTRLPLTTANINALLIGAGSGYLAQILSRLVKTLTVIEHNDLVANIARQNLNAFKPANVRILLGEGEQGAPDRAPFQLIISSCVLHNLEELQQQLAPGGVLAVLEGGDSRWSALVLYEKTINGIQRQETGLLDFNRNSGEILIDLGVMDEVALQTARKDAQRLGKPLISVIQRHANVENVDVYRALANRLGMAFDEADNLFTQLDRRLFRKFSRTFLDHYRLLPLCMKDRQLVIATDNPDVQADILERMHSGGGVELMLVTPTDYRRLWSALNISDKSGKEFEPAVPLPADTDDEFPDDLNNQVSPYLVAIYEAILLDAVSENASDIHLERYNERVRVRLRVDGELYDLPQYQLTPAELAGVINVIKTRAELDISERRLPQGGRSRLKAGNVIYDLRIQTQPALHGEHAVIRLLPQRGRALAMEELGMAPSLLKHYRRLLDNPAGLVLIVGPTGSGKSTTLSAGLQELADDGRRKVITVEDPIEYAIDNIQQTRVRSNIGFNFADAMRAFVRQDPDVVLVGEIRDMETALEAIRASQTGHLVLSTLHCNDAVDAVQRLYDLGVHPNSIAGELLAIMAQRLAKRICPQCKTEVAPDPAILAELFPEEVPANFRCYIGRGCGECNGRGTRGRVAVVEYLQVDADIRHVISRHPPVGELRWRALDAGLVTMRDSALDLVIQGVISLDELPRLLPQERMAPEVRGGRRSMS